LVRRQRELCVRLSAQSQRYASFPIFSVVQAGGDGRVFDLHLPHHAGGGERGARRTWPAAARRGAGVKVVTGVLRFQGFMSMRSRGLAIAAAVFVAVAALAAWRARVAAAQRFSEELTRARDERSAGLIELARQRLLRLSRQWPRDGVVALELGRC